MELPQFAPPDVNLPDLGASSVPPFEGLGLKGLILGASEWESAAWNGIVDAFGYAGDAVREAADAVAADIEQLGNWLGDVTGVEMLSDGASFAAGTIRNSGNLVGTMIAAVPHGVAAVHDYVSNISTCLADLLLAPDERLTDASLALRDSRLPVPRLEAPVQRGLDALHSLAERRPVDDLDQFRELAPRFLAVRHDTLTSVAAGCSARSIWVAYFMCQMPGSEAGHVLGKFLVGERCKQCPKQVNDGRHLRLLRTVLC